MFLDEIRQWSQGNKKKWDVLVHQSRLTLLSSERKAIRQKRKKTQRREERKKKRGSLCRFAHSLFIDVGYEKKISQFVISGFAFRATFPGVRSGAWALRFSLPRQPGSPPLSHICPPNDLSLFGLHISSYPDIGHFHSNNTPWPYCRRTNDAGSPSGVLPSGNHSKVYPIFATS